MSVRIDHNGKVYTDVVNKQPAPVVIQTVSHAIRGQIFLRPGQRVRDVLNDAAEPFLAVTAAEVMSADGQRLHAAPFLTVNKQHIVWLLPQADLPANPAEPGA